VGAGELACSPRLLAICFCSWCVLAVVCQLSCFICLTDDVAPASCVSKGEGEGNEVTHLASLLSVSIRACVVCEPWRMVVVRFVVRRVWHGVVMLLSLLLCAVVVGGVERRSRVVVGGRGDRGDVGSHDDGGG